MATLLHYLWTKAVGTKDYIKKDWQEFESQIERLEKIEKWAHEVNRTHNFALKPDATEKEGLNAINNLRNALVSKV